MMSSNASFRPFHSLGPLKWLAAQTLHAQSEGKELPLLLKVGVSLLVLATVSGPALASAGAASELRQTRAIKSKPAVAKKANAKKEAVKDLRQILTDVVSQTSRFPERRAEIVATAVRGQPSLSTQIERAGEIGTLLSTYAGQADIWNGRPFPGAPVSASRNVPILAGNSVARANSQVFNTWNFMPARTIPVGPTDQYGWALSQTELSNFYNADAQREFGANWGNAAVGQTTALNQFTPGGLAGWRGRGVTVAVIDGGIDARFANPLNPLDGFAYVHPEFAGRLDLRSRRMLPNGTFDLAISEDSGSHGTHVAGTIAAAFDGAGVTGVAPGANILALRGVGGGGDSIWSMAYAASQPDVRIINGSYGPSAMPGETTWTTGNLRNEWIAVHNALAGGKVLVFATGNDFETAAVQAQNPTGIPLFPFIRPSNANHGAYNDGGQFLDFSATDRLPGFIVAVTNLDHNLRIASSSNRCGVAAFWCISAPGGGSGTGTPEGILSTVVQGVASAGGTPTVGAGPQAGYAFFHGTSMATPHVSGVIAVLMEAFPTYSARDIIRLMFATAEDLGARGVDRIYGHGLARLDRALAAGPQIDAIPGAFVRQVPVGQPEFWAAPISSDRQLVVQGARSGAHGENDGDLIIAGVTEFRGGVNVETGDLVVEGTLTAPSVTLESNARLLGDGVLNGNLIVHGALKPGLGPAELQIHGSVTIMSGGQFQVDIDGRSDAGGPGSYSHAYLFGAGSVFKAGGSFSPSFRGQDEGADNTFTPRIGDRFRVVSAAEGARVEGQFASIDPEADETGATGLQPNTRLALIYHPTSITLAFNPETFANLSAHGVALNRRQSGIGAALDRMQATGAITGPAAGVFDRLAGLDSGALPKAMEQLSGSGHSPVLRSSFTSSQMVTGLIGQRLNGLRSGGDTSGTMPAMAFTSEGGFGFSGRNHPLAFAALPGAAGTPGAVPGNYSLWGKMFGQWSRLGSDGAAPTTRTTSGGAIVGVDMAISREWTLGLAGSIARSTISANGLSGTANTYLGVLYGSYVSGGFEADVVAGVTRSEFQTTRTLDFSGTTQTAASKSRGTGFLGSADIGYRFNIQMAMPFFVKPFVGINHHGLNRGTFAETGAGALGLAFPSQRFGVTQGRLGATIGTTSASINGVSVSSELTLAWARDLWDTTLTYRTSLAGQPMTLPAVAPGRDAFLVRGQVTANLDRNFRAFAGYSGEFRTNAVTHRIDGGVRYEW